MLDVWVIPAAIILLVGVAAFYIVLKVAGGTGVRTDGRTLVDKPEAEEESPPQMRK